MPPPAWSNGRFTVIQPFGRNMARPQLELLQAAVMALGALSLAQGITFQFDTLPTTIAEWWPSAL